MGDAPKPRQAYLLRSRSYSDRGEPVPPRGLERSSVGPACRETGSAWRRWLFDPRHPLTARVFVNRMWQMHFGRGLVETAEDFGAQGSIPTHPELLDWLAVELHRVGLGHQALHKTIVMSATYRQRSDVSDDAAGDGPA